MTHILDRDGIDDDGRPWRAEYLQGSEIPQWLVVVDEHIVGTVVGHHSSDEAFRRAVHVLIRQKLVTG